MESRVLHSGAAQVRPAGYVLLGRRTTPSRVAATVSPFRATGDPADSSITTPPFGRADHRASVGTPDRGDVELQRHLLADHGPAAFHCGVPADATVLAVDHRRALETDPEVAPRVALGTGQLEVDRFGDAADGQLPSELEVGLVDLLHRGRGEDDGRMLVPHGRPQWRPQPESCRDALFARSSPRDDAGVVRPPRGSPPD